MPSPHPLPIRLRCLGLTRPQAAALLGVSLRTLHGWCAKPGTVDHREVPEWAWRVLELIEHVPGVREHLEGCAIWPRSEAPQRAPGMPD